MNSSEITVTCAVLGVFLGCVLAALWRIQNDIRRIRVILALEVARVLRMLGMREDEPKEEKVVIQ